MDDFSTRLGDFDRLPTKNTMSKPKPVIRHLELEPGMPTEMYKTLGAVAKKIIGQRCNGESLDRHNRQG